MEPQYTTAGLITYWFGAALLFAIIGYMAGYKSVANHLQRRLTRGWQVLNFFSIWLAITLGQRITNALIPHDGPGQFLETMLSWAGCLLIGAAISALYLTRKGQPVSPADDPIGNPDG
jgi:hypothetical protein